MEPRHPVELNPLEFHVLLALAGSRLYGYAIAEAVREQSGGAVAPRAGSLYRVLARLLAGGFVKESETAGDAPHPGLARRYYALTRHGRQALAVEADRLKRSARLAHERLGEAAGR